MVINGSFWIRGFQTPDGRGRLHVGDVERYEMVIMFTDHVTAESQDGPTPPGKKLTC